MAKKKAKAIVNPKVHVRGDTVLVITGKNAGKRGQGPVRHTDRSRVL